MLFVGLVGFSFGLGKQIVSVVVIKMTGVPVLSLPQDVVGRSDPASSRWYLAI